MKNQFNKSIIPQGFVSQPPKAAQAPATDTGVTHNDIAKRAYEIYVENGCLPGQSEQNWQQAEQEQKNLSKVTNLLKKQDY